MRRTLLAVLSLLAVAAATRLSAQNPTARPAGPPAAPPAAPGELRGVVVEAETGTPIARASVALRDPNAVLVAGAVADDQGAFRIQGLRPGVYAMRVTMIGFSPRVQQLTIAAAAPQVALGKVALARIAVKLGEVSTLAERDAVTIEPDRNSYRAKDVAPAAQNASDVLENVPAVQVDGDGKVSLRGNENVVVQINGRPTPMRGPQLASYLKTLPATIVDRIEVVPNPSAKYDPEGMAGIINVVLKQQADLGLSAGATVSAANQDRYSGSANMGYQEGPWTTFLSVGHNADERDVLGVNDRQRFSSGATSGYTDQDLVGRNGFGGTNLNGNVDYRLNERDVLYSTFALGRRNSMDASTMTYHEFDADHAPIDAYLRTRDTRADGSLLDATAGFRRTWDAKQKHELATELRATQNDDDERTTLWRIPTTSGSGDPFEGEIDRTDARQRQLVAQLDYTKTFAGRRKLEAGYKGTGRWLDRDFRVGKDSLGDGGWQASDLSNRFAFDEQVEAAYGVVSQGIGRFDLQGGLRAEYASRDFSLSSESYPYDYTSLFPSAAVTFSRSEALQYRASYSRRIRRPGTQELNPFPQFFDVQNVFFGNPRLAPEYTDAWELGIVRNFKVGSLQLSPFFRHTTDIIQVEIDTDAHVDGRDVTTVSFRNLATSDSWGADLNGTLRLGPKLNAFGGLNVFKQVTDGGSTSSLAANTVTWMGRLNASSQITSALTVQGSWFYRAPMRIPRGRFSSFSGLNFSLRQKINGDRNSITMRVLDPFNTQRMSVRAGDDNLIQLTERRFGVRAVFVSYQYTFGRPPRIRVRPEEQQPQGTGFPQ